jgi:hypothetical protein
MDKSERFRLLLERGYFPEELPPPFHTSDLATYRASISAAWAAVGPNYPNSTPEAYSVPRMLRLRRNLAIVSPVAQFHLAKLVADNWVAIRKHLRRSRYCLEIPEIVADSERAIPPPDFELMALKRIEIGASFDHILLSDISRFYGTLYTHAIPWALHNKEWCKRNLHSSAYNETLGNRLDAAVRRGQDNQTLGIPIGPDTSRVLSEIVGVAIDVEVQGHLKLNNARAFRAIDDWYVGFENAGEAEDAIATLATSCRKYELELNAEKTRTLSATASIDQLWPTDLREHRFSRFASDQAKVIEHYFTKAFHFAAKHPTQNVLDFAIKRTRNVRIQQRDWPRYESFLLKAARANPTVIPAVVQILVSYNHNKYALGRERIAKLIEDTIRENAPLGYHAEVSWALFLAKALRVSVSNHAAQAISGLENSVSALLALDLRARGLIFTGLDVDNWLLSMSTQGLNSHMWLLAYEANLKGWLAGREQNFVDQHPYFAVLKSKRISFYDERKNVKHIRSVVPKSPSSAFLEFIRQMREAVPTGALATSVSRMD